MKKLAMGIAMICGLFAYTAFAAGFKDDISTASLRQNSRSALIKLNGILNCKMAELNDGSPCALSLLEASGKTINLGMQGDLMRLYHSGVRKVALEGTANGEGVFSVSSYTAIND